MFKARSGKSCSGREADVHGPSDEFLSNLEGDRDGNAAQAYSKTFENGMSSDQFLLNKCVDCTTKVTFLAIFKFFKTFSNPVSHHLLNIMP